MNSSSNVDGAAEEGGVGGREPLPGLVPSPSNVVNLQQNDVNTFINCSSSCSLEVLRVSVEFLFLFE